VASGRSQATASLSLCIFYAFPGDIIINVAYLNTIARRIPRKVDPEEEPSMMSTEHKPETATFFLAPLGSGHVKNAI